MLKGKAHESEATRQNTGRVPDGGLARHRPGSKVQRHVFRLQKRIYRATQREDVRTVHKLQKLLVKSWYARLLAVRRITQDNRGKHTAGIDGVKIPHTAPTMATGQRRYTSMAPPPRSTHLDTETWIPDKAPAGHSNPNGPGTANVRAPSLGTCMGSQTVTAHLWLSPRTVLPGCHRSHLYRHPVSAAICAQTGYREMLRFCMLMPPSRTRETCQRSNIVRLLTGEQAQQINMLRISRFLCAYSMHSK